MTEQKKNDFKIDSDDQVLAGQTAVFPSFHVIFHYIVSCFIFR